VGQLNFFKWALENNIVDYVQKHMKEIEDDMNLRCENIKKPGTKIAKAIGASANTSAGTGATEDEDTTTREDQGVGTAGATGTKKNKLQDGIVSIVSEKGIKTKKASGTRKKRKEISQSASKSLSIHNLPTTLIFD